MLVADFFHQRKIFMKQVMDESAKGIFTNYWNTEYYKTIYDISNTLHVEMKKTISPITIHSEIIGTSHVTLVYTNRELSSPAYKQFSLLQSIKNTSPENHRAYLEKYTKKYMSEIDKHRIHHTVTLELNKKKFNVYITPDYQKETFLVKIYKDDDLISAYINIKNRNKIEPIEKEFPNITPIETIGEYIRLQLNKHISEIIVDSLKEQF